MSEGGKKTKEADLDAGSITESSKIGVPGKVPRTGPITSKDPTGDDYIDHGAVCDDKEGSPDCFLNGRQRGRLIEQFQHRIAEASQNYKMAAQAVRVDELVKEEEELPMFALILLDLVALHVASKIAHALAHLRGKGLHALDAIAKQAKQAGTHGEMEWYALAKRGLDALNAEHLKNNIEHAIDGAKGSAEHHVQKVNNRGESDEKHDSANYLDYLTDQAGLGYAKIRERTPGASNDAELVTLWAAFDAVDHTFGQYKQAIAEKLERYKKSGVSEIMKSGTTYDTGQGEDDKPDWEDTGTFVVWNEYLSGHPKKLVFEHFGQSPSAKKQIEGGARAGRAHGAPGILDAKKRADTTRPDNTERGKLRDTGLRGGKFSAKADSPFVVPDEFVEFAVARHQIAWGQPVGTELIDDSDPTVWGEDRAKAAEANRAKLPSWPPKPPTPPAMPTGAAKKIQLGPGPTTTTKIQPHATTSPDFLKLKDKKNVSIAGDDPSKDL